MKEFKKDILYHLALGNLKYFMGSCKYYSIKEKRKALEELLKNVHSNWITKEEKEMLVLYYTENSFRELSNKYEIAWQNIAKKIKRVERDLINHYFLVLSK
ncbi:MAG: hypothetical protein AB1571_04300 [Nanoarchaeota archaeon]